MAKGMESGLVGLYLKSTLAGEWFTISRNWLSLEGAVLARSARFRMSKHQNTEKKSHG